MLHCVFITALHCAVFLLYPICITGYEMKVVSTYFVNVRETDTEKACIYCVFYETRNTFCRTRSLSNATVSFLITWRSRSSKYAAVYKTSNPMIFHGDMAIYRFSKWWPSAILELFYHHTRPPTKSLLLAATCQNTCMTQNWREHILLVAVVLWHEYVCDRWIYSKRTITQLIKHYFNVAFTSTADISSHNCH